MFIVFNDSVGQPLCLTNPFHYNKHDWKQTGNLICEDKEDVDSGQMFSFAAEKI